MTNQVHTTWPELAIDLYDKLTGRGAEISYEFDNLEIGVPSGTNSAGATANWKLKGLLKIRTRDLPKQ
jgi:hypothetical protein